MSRWESNALERLREAAIELFSTQGFDRTTVAEIATHTGLTERTFFNHFADKRDVLFGRTSERHRDAVAQGVIDSEADLLPLDAVLRGLQSAADEALEDYRAPAVRRACLTWATLLGDTH